VRGNGGFIITAGVGKYDFLPCANGTRSFRLPTGIGKFIFSFDLWGVCRINTTTSGLLSIIVSCPSDSIYSYPIPMSKIFHSTSQSRKGRESGFALVVALGELQKHLGLDQRVAATADLLRPSLDAGGDDAPERLPANAWTGVAE
jgi:hypothetical protein